MNKLKNILIYLIYIMNQSPRNAGKEEKEISKIFKNRPIMTVDENKKVVDFLDVTLNLITGLHQLYKKTNITIKYIHCDSDHPSPIIKNLSKGKELRLSNNSANVNIFNKAAKPYIAALRENGHKQKVKYRKIENPQEKAVKTNRKHATGEIKTPLYEERDKTKERNKKRIRKSNINSPFSLSPPISEKCFLNSYTHVHQQTSSTKYSIKAP